MTAPGCGEVLALCQALRAQGQLPALRSQRKVLVTQKKSGLRYAVGVKNADQPEPLSGSAAPSQPTAQPSPLQPDKPRPAERWTVDGLEDGPHGKLARLEREDGTTFDLPLRFLPYGLREGDLLEVQDRLDGVTVRLLKAETTARREAMQTRLEALNSAEHGNSAEADRDGAEEITV